ncbi:MAG: hypothetical protein AB7H71_19165, partial [Alphaproteobacteria bacterium]
MNGLFKYGAVAGVFLLGAGPAALAQNYNPAMNQSGSPSWSQSGSQQRGWNSAGPGWNQGYGSSWNQSAMQGNEGSSGPSARDAYQELSRYGYNNIQGMDRSQGWEARATRNGDRVHVFIDDDGRVATYRG